MGTKQVDIQQDLIITEGLEAVAAGYVGFGAKADGLYRKLWGGEEKRLLTEDDLGSGGGGSIEIPKLQLVSGRHYDLYNYPLYITDILSCYWQSNAREWITYNPEIWLFRYKRNGRDKFVDGIKVAKKLNKKWSHPPHLNGSKYVGSNFFTGSIKHPVTEIRNAGYHTEWPMTNLNSLEKMVIPINEFEFVYGQDYSHNPINELLTAETFFNYDPTKIRFTTKTQMGGSNHSVAFRFAIVIDNPDSENCPKLIGELSDPIYLIANSMYWPQTVEVQNFLNWSKSAKGYKF